MELKGRDLLLTETKCSWCDGTGQQNKTKPCPAISTRLTRVRNRVCAVCGGMWNGGNGHKLIDTGEKEDCWKCKGKGTVTDDKNTYIPERLSKEILSTIPIIVIRNYFAKMTKEEQVFTMGSLFNCVDYNRWKLLSNENLIKSAFDSNTFQISNLFEGDPSDGKPLKMKFLCIICKDQGYIVHSCKIEELAKAKDVANKCRETLLTLYKSIKTDGNIPDYKKAQAKKWYIPPCY